MDSIVKAVNVSKIFDMGKVKVKALDDISIDIKQGEYVAIMGPSGSGKTTLLNVLSALLRPTHGEVYIRSKPISKMDDNQLARIRGKTLGFVFQTFNLIPRMTAIENVMLPLWFEGIEPAKRETIAKKVLADVGLEDRMMHRPNELSGGQKQRVAIARALANNPDIIVADEPTGNLDSKSGEQVLDIIDDLNVKHGKTVLMVTHEREIGELAERIINLKDGKLVNNEIIKKRNKTGGAK
ncbi:MAG: ABC transporter ATP-binding protein [Candidatus Diapherotrites archaeon]